MNQVLDAFLKELAENDRKVQAESYEKDSDKINQKFVDFIKSNNCKVKEERHGKEEDDEDEHENKNQN